jgi:hypothetical protein
VAAVKPNGGYRALTTDDDISGEFIGEQQVGVEWWLPEHGCDSLENTLDSITYRLLAAVRDWLPTAVTATPQPPADGEVGELVEWMRSQCTVHEVAQTQWAKRFARAATLLEQLSAPAPVAAPVAVSEPQPVAVSERLPGAKDCALWPGDPEVTPWCWAGKDIDGGWEWAQISMLGLGTDTLSRIIAGGGWTHWLPANALPIPENTND